jgi:hypothetical protein
VNKPIEPGDMVAFPVEGIYVTGRVTRVLPGGWLVKTPEGHLSRETIVLPMRNAEESEALVRLIAGLPNLK